jgi:hypothetical protein
MLFSIEAVNELIEKALEFARKEVANDANFLQELNFHCSVKDLAELKLDEPSKIGSFISFIYFQCFFILRQNHELFVNQSYLTVFILYRYTYKTIGSGIYCLRYLLQLFDKSMCCSIIISIV